MKRPMMALALIAGAWIAPIARAQQAPPSADQMFTQRMNDPVWKDAFTGENFGWHASYGMSAFLDTYLTTGDQSYLDAGVKYYDALLARMDTGPDGYKGWIGPFIYDTKYWCDAHVSDAILMGPMLDFSVKVLQDPKLKEKYGAKAQTYLDEAKKDFFEKWDTRGTWHEDGPYGFYEGWNKYGLPGELKDWKLVPALDRKADCTLPFNKQIDCGVMAIRIWQATGDEKFKHRAELMFGYLKSRMQNFNGAYHWNYEEPAGNWDFAVKRRGGPIEYRGWIGVHPERNYQEGEVNNIVKAYNAGIVFTEADIKGIIHTNLKVMWNGDEAKPLYANSTIDLQNQLGDAKLYHPADDSGKAGTLWTGLAQFDPEIRKLAGERRKDPIPPSFARRDVKGDVTIPQVYAQFPLGNVRTVMMAAAMPSVFPIGEKSRILCKLISQQNLEVALYSPDGKTQIASLHKGNDNYTVEIPFDGTDPATGKAFDPGDYRIRWTVPGDGYREFPITIQPKK